MTTEILIRLPFLLPLENRQVRMHYHAKRDVKDLIINEFTAAGILPGAAPMEFAEITIWRCSTQRPDTGGLWGSIKQLLDVLQPQGALRKMRGKMTFTNPGGIGVIRGDDPDHAVVRPLWTKARTLTEQHTLVRIRRLDAMPAQERMPEAVA